MVRKFAIVIIIMTVAFSTVYAQNLKITPYGFFKLDMAYDQARTNNGNYVFYVQKVGDDEDKDNEFNMTARQTRLGMNLAYEEVDGKKVSARFEGDFYGGGTENKNFVMLRHAYMKIEFENAYMIAGQTSDIISPLVASTVVYVVLWESGNIGYRRPQLQFGNKVSEGVSFAGAFTRNIAGSVDSDGVDDGEDNPFPSVQARLSYLKAGKLNVGVSGHYGRNEYVSTVDDDTYSSYSANAHLSYTVSDKFSFKGEFFTGKALNQYLGGIGQGFNKTLDKPIETLGGWLDATVKANDKTRFNFGVGIEKPKQETLSVNDRDFNRSIFANLFTNLAHKTTLGLEATFWTTGYYNGTDSDRTSSLRLQASFIMNF